MTGSPRRRPASGAPGPSGPRRRLTKEQRLRKRREFLSVQRRGRNRHTRHFVIVVQERADPGPARLGITVSRRVGNAVARNRVKRRVREFFRLHHESLPAARDFVFVAKTGAEQLTYADVVRELASGLDLGAGPRPRPQGAAV